MKEEGIKRSLDAVQMDHGVTVINPGLSIGKIHSIL